MGGCTLVGQYDSPFVRRAAAALNHHGVVFDRAVVSVFANFDEMLRVNPLGKVPVLILPDGFALPDSRAIIEWAEGEPTGAPRLTPSDPDLRRQCLRIEAIAIGLAEKTYERGIETVRKPQDKRVPEWIARLTVQIASALDWLEARAPAQGFMLGEGLSRADLAVAAATTYMAAKQPQHLDAGRHARLLALRDRCERLPCFSASPYSGDEAAQSGWRPEVL